MSYAEDKRVHELTQISSGYNDSDRIPYQDTDALDELKYTTVGNLADYITENATNIGGYDPDPLDPTTAGVPTGLTASNKAVYFSPAISGGYGARVQLDWDANTEDNFSHYVVRFKDSGETIYNYVYAATNSIFIDGLIPGEEYHFGVCSVNRMGFQSSFSANITETMGTDSSAPGAPSNVSATAGIQYALVEWDSNTEADLSHYEIYRHTSDVSGSASKVGETSRNYFIDGALTADEYWWWVKAVDTSANSSGFSLSDNATVTDVESDDVVSLAAAKVLIDGVVYLSNWRKTGDLTKIDGGSISANTVTATQITVDNLSVDLTANMGELTAGSIVISKGDPVTDNIWLNDSDDGGLAIGGTVKADAPFKVSSTGALTASSATIQSSASGQRIVIDSTGDNMVFYNSAGNDVVTIDDDIYSTGAPGIKVESSSGGTIECRIDANRFTRMTAGALACKSTASGGDLDRFTITQDSNYVVRLTELGHIKGTGLFIGSAASIQSGGALEVITEAKVLQNVTLSASLINAGTLGAAYLPNHSAALVTSGTMSSARVKAPSDVNKACYFASDGVLTASAITSTELDRLDGLSNNIMTLLNGKASTSHSHTFASITSKPTTLAGYGITDAASDAELSSHAGDADIHISGLSTVPSGTPTYVVGYSSTYSGWYKFSSW